ncbi:hypothetical protein GGI42DRAFT_326074 [Trichoderma sp. SZMC 28013]
MRRYTQAVNAVQCPTAITASHQLLYTSSSALHLHQSTKAKVTSHPNPSPATACIKSHHTTHHSSSRPVLPTRVAAAAHPSLASGPRTIHPPRAWRITQSGHISSLTFSPFSFLNTNTISPFISTSHPFRHLASNRPSQGPAPRQALLWLDGFDGLWPTASAHFPRRHNDPFCCFVSTKPSPAVSPFSLFPFVSREKRSQSLCAHRRRRDRCLDIYSETHFPSMQQSVISYPNLCALSSAPRRFAQANTAAAQAMPHQIHSCRSYLPLRHPNPSRHSSSHQHVHIG